MDPAVAHAMCDAADPVVALAGNVPFWAELAGDPRLLAALQKATVQVHQFMKDAA